jgi:hypothetical protein
MSRIVTYETEADADMSTAAAAGEEETPLLVLGGQARRSLGHLAGSAQAGVAVMSVEASSELVRLTRVIVSALTERRNGTLTAMIEALDREDAAPEKGFSSPLQEAVFLLLLRPRVLRVRPAKRHLGPLMQDLATRLQALLGMPVRPPRVVVLSSAAAGAGNAADQPGTLTEQAPQGQHVGPREIYREVLARVRAALTARISA